MLETHTRERKEEKNSLKYEKGTEREREREKEKRERE